jgi:beta-glucanase (GH16 family)
MIELLRKVIRITIFFCIIFVLNVCSSDKNNVTDPNDTVPSIPGWKLVWNDEFDGSTIDQNKWGYEVNGDGGGNNEIQYYTARDTNSFINDGKLVIVARPEIYKVGDNTWYFTSARLRTLNKGDWKYGRIEVSAKVPTGVGTWPAIWMLSSDWEYGGWPESGEIDIMEHVGYDPNVIHGSIHTLAYNHRIGTQITAQLKIPTATTEFHKYAIEWFEDHIDFFIDDFKYLTFTNENKGWQYWPFDKRFHLILNLAVGGSWGGAQGVDFDAFPAQMEVDFVRVYEKAD